MSNVLWGAALIGFALLTADAVVVLLRTVRALRELCDYFDKKTDVAGYAYIGGGENTLRE